MTEIPIDECLPPRQSLLNKLQSRSFVPLTAMLQLTDRCNLSCKHCLEPHNLYNENELTTQQWIDIINILADSGTMMLTLSGGEPTIHNDFFKIIKEANRRNFSILLKSNGTTFNEIEIEKIWDSGVTKLDVSLYSHIPTEHDAFVGLKGSFKKTTDSLRTFSKLGGIARVSIIAMNWNADHIIPLMNLSETENWIFSVDSRIQPQVTKDVSPLLLRAPEQKIINIFNDIRLKSRIPCDNNKKLDVTVCGAGKTMMVIRPNGDVWPCSIWPVVLGNILQTPYKDICDPIKNERLLQIDKFKWSDTTKCNSCDVADYCQRCPGSGQLEFGDYKKAGSVDCELAKIYKKVHKNEE